MVIGLFKKPFNALARPVIFTVSPRQKYSSGEFIIRLSLLFAFRLLLSFLFHRQRCCSLKRWKIIENE